MSAKGESKKRLRERAAADFLESAKQKGFAQELDREALRQIADEVAEKPVTEAAFEAACDKILGIASFAYGRMEGLTANTRSGSERHLGQLLTHTTNLIEALDVLAWGESDAFSADPDDPDEFSLDTEGYLWRAEADRGKTLEEGAQAFSDFWGKLQAQMPEPSLRKHLEGLRKVLHRAHNIAVQDGKGKTGKRGKTPRNVARRDAIELLCLVYHQLTGRDPGRTIPNPLSETSPKYPHGPFTTFCSTSLDPVFGNWDGDGSEDDIRYAVAQYKGSARLGKKRV